MRKSSRKSHLNGLIVGIIVSCWILSLLAPPPAQARKAKEVVQGDISFIDTLYGCAMANPTTLWTCGFAGVIYRSIDGGKTWTRQESKTSQTLFDIVSFDEMHGIVCGQAGTVLKTRDGGKTWESMETPRALALFKMSFADTNIGCAVGDRAYVIYTSDGGVTWQEGAVSPFETISGSNDEQSSEEAGSSSSEPPREYILYGVSLADAKIGYAVGEFSIVLKTTDGGRNWTGSTLKEAQGKSLFAVYAETPNRVWVVGIDGIMFVSEDGGGSWKQVELPIHKHLFSVKVKDGRGWAVGKEGIYLVSEDAGVTWKQVDIGARFYLQSICINSDHGMIVGAHGWVLKTNDGGKSFQVLRKFP
jgi:photosystem II stability/assembly factor-like uncharacterized protein